MRSGLSFPRRHHQAESLRRLWVGMCLLAAWALPAGAQPLPSPSPAVNVTAAEVERPLTLGEAVQLGLQNNVKTKISKERIREAEARIEHSEAAFMPQIRFVTSQSNRTVNLAQQGLAGGSFPIPILVGPFFSFDSRIQVAHNLIDAAARWRRKSSEVGKLIAEVDHRVAVQTVKTLTSLAYVTLVGARQARVAALADFEVSQRLVKLARDQRDAGVAAGIDVTRAEAQRAEQLLRVNATSDGVDRANLELSRLLGLPLTGRIQPTEELFPPLDEVTTFEKAYARGLANRLDLQLALRHEEQLVVDISAARAGMSPVVALAGDYGLAGNTPGTNVYGTYSLGLALSVPLYDGGASDAKEAELVSRLEQARLSRKDLEVQVEQDVRTAFLKLNLAHHQIDTAKTGRELAQREVKMSTDRFKAGLTNSLEVATAQASLTRARDAEVQAQVRYNLALVELAATMGSPEAIYEIYQRDPMNPNGRPRE